MRVVLHMELFGVCGWVQGIKNSRVHPGSFLFSNAPATVLVSTRIFHFLLFNSPVEKIACIRLYSIAMSNPPPLYEMCAGT